MKPKLAIVLKIVAVALLFLAFLGYLFMKPPLWWDFARGMLMAFGPLWLLSTWLERPTTKERQRG